MLTILKGYPLADSPVDRDIDQWYVDRRHKGSTLAEVWGATLGIHQIVVVESDDFLEKYWVVDVSGASRESAKVVSRFDDLDVACVAAQLICE